MRPEYCLKTSGTCRCLYYSLIAVSYTIVTIAVIICFLLEPFSFIMNIWAQYADPLLRVYIRIGMHSVFFLLCVAQ